MGVRPDPFPHQVDAFNKHKAQPFWALFMDMGTGKTRTAIDIACDKYARGVIDQVLVLAPNNVHTQWAEEQMPLHCELPYSAFVWRSTNEKNYKQRLSNFLFKDRAFRWFFVNIEAVSAGTVTMFLSEFLGSSRARTLVIVDEASRIKNHTTQRFKRLLALRRKYPVYTGILTGTPMAKSAADVWAMYEFLQPRYLGCSFTAFNRKHSLTYLARVGAAQQLIETNVDEKTFWFLKKRMAKMKEEFAVHNPDIYKHPTPVYSELTYKYHISIENLMVIDNAEQFVKSKHVEELKTYVAPVTTFIRKADCLQLPEKVYEEHIFEPPAEYVRLLKQLKNYAVATYGNNELTLMHKASLQLRARQICGGFFPYDVRNLEGTTYYDTEPILASNPKVAYIREDLPEIGEQQFIIWAVFPNEIRMLTKELADFNVDAIYGAVDTLERNEILKRFHAGELQGIVANPSVMGYGFNMQQASVQYWYSRDFRTEARLQAEDRSHRMGIVRSPVYKDLLYNVASEKAVLSCIKQGASMNEYFKAHSIEEILDL